MKKEYETMFDVNEMMKNAWKMMYVFPPIPIFICQQLFFVSLLIYFLKSNINWITSSAIYYHQLLLLHISMPIQSKKQKQERKFLKIKKTTTVAWNCLCFTLIYYQSSFMLLRTTIYWQIGIKKLRSVFSTKLSLPIIVAHTIFNQQNE